MLVGFVIVAGSCIVLFFLLDALGCCGARTSADSQTATTAPIVWTEPHWGSTSSSRVIKETPADDCAEYNVHFPIPGQQNLEYCECYNLSRFPYTRSPFTTESAFDVSANRYKWKGPPEAMPSAEGLRAPQTMTMATKPQQGDDTLSDEEWQLHIQRPLDAVCRLYCGSIGSFLCLPLMIATLGVWPFLLCCWNGDQDEKESCGCCSPHVNKTVEQECVRITASPFCRERGIRVELGIFRYRRGDSEHWCKFINVAMRRHPRPVAVAAKETEDGLVDPTSLEQMA